MGGGAPHSGGAAVPPRAQWQAEAKAAASAQSADPAALKAQACGSKRVCSSSALGLRRQCKPYRGVSWDADLPDIRKAGGGSMARGKYLATAMRHRFFLVAPGTV